MNLDEYRNYLVIDKHKLDDELKHQASLFYTISEACMQAIAERDYLKEMLARADADCDADIRNAFKDEKITEAMVKNEILGQKTHKKAFDDWLVAKTKADQLEALKEAFRQRGFMLRDLCQLHVSQYYGDISVQGTNATDTARYNERRERLRAGRENRT
jgi:hypothetical protein